MSRIEKIKNKLKKEFSPSYIKIIDQSDKHTTHLETPNQPYTHLYLIISASDLNNLPSIQSHQKIYDLIREEFQTGLHALRIKILREKI